MTNSVLCAVDVSNGDDDINIIQKAAQLAALDGVQLDVIAVVPDFGMSQVGAFFDKDHHDKMVSEAKGHLNILVSKALDAAHNEKVRHVIATGRAYEEVLKLAKSIGASLIVVGAHKADLADYLLGPNAARIVRHANCSVYVVR
ncbi:universal stress protein [Planktotalea arctica]|uniref:universal stress protein n=1 Tax=Planktotalea arctica TaxID=1481893 RepID=UPI003219FBF4